MIVRKSHGLGNDYLVVEGSLRPLTAAQVRLLCDRHCGPGGDGVLERVPSDNADAGLRIWNPDGSQAEKSGNGIRIFARWLVDHQGLPAAHSIEVASGVVRCVVGETVTVEMGRATLDPAEVPCTERLWGTLKRVGGADLALHAVGMGNPHCVVFVDDLEAIPWQDWGRELETSAWFPNRTNVQFARVTGPSEVEVRVFERGAGPTLASGSSACAVAVVAVRLGRVRSPVTVRMPGGALRVEVAPDLSVVLDGPVEEVGVFTPSSALLARLARL